MPTLEENVQGFLTNTTDAEPTAGIYARSRMYLQQLLDVLAEAKKDLATLEENIEKQIVVVTASKIPYSVEKEWLCLMVKVGLMAKPELLRYYLDQLIAKCMIKALEAKENEQEGAL